MYTATCDCGKTQTVQSADANTVRPCGCGQDVLVPSLTELRRQARLAMAQAAEATGPTDGTPIDQPANESTPPPHDVAPAQRDVRAGLGFMAAGLLIALLTIAPIWVQDCGSYLIALAAVGFGIFYFLRGVTRSQPRN